MNMLWAVLQHAEEAAGQAAEHAPNVFSLSANTSFWTLIIFGLLFLLLAKFAFPPILGYAAAREQRIQEALDTAARERAEAERLVEQQRQQLVEARQQGQQLLQEARQASDRLRDDMLAQARTEQQALLERARLEIEREREKAVQLLRREAVDIAIAAASKLLERRLDAETDRRIVEDYLEKVEADRTPETVG